MQVGKQMQGSIMIQYLRKKNFILRMRKQQRSQKEAMSSPAMILTGRKKMAKSMANGRKQDFCLL